MVTTTREIELWDRGTKPFFLPLHVITMRVFLPASITRGGTSETKKTVQLSCGRDMLLTTFLRTTSASPHTFLIPVWNFICVKPIHVKPLSRCTGNKAIFDLALGRTNQCLPDQSVSTILYMKSTPFIMYFAILMALPFDTIRFHFGPE